MSRVLEIKYKGEMTMTKEKLRMSNEELQQYTTLLEDWIPDDATIAIGVGDHYICSIEGSSNIQIKEGQPIEPGSIAEEVIRNRRKIKALVNQSPFGIPYYGIGYPIQIHDEPGALIVILSPSYQQRPEPFRYLTGKQQEDWSPIPIEQISHIESLQKKTWFYANDEGYCTNFTLKDLHIRLPQSFLRIHRSYIVNIAYIQRISRDLSSNLILTLKDETELPVSQTYATELRAVLGF